MNYETSEQQRLVSFDTRLRIPSVTKKKVTPSIHIGEDFQDEIC